MAPRFPHLRERRYVFLKEHREAQGITAEQMGDRIGMTRESVYRLEKEQSRINSIRMQQYAEVLGISVEELWRPPGATPSIDTLVSTQSEDFRRTAYDVIARLMGKPGHT